MKFAVLCFIIASVFTLGGTNSPSSSENALIKKYIEDLQKNGYNTKIMPVVPEGNPLNVTCSMYILDVYQIDEEMMEFQAQMYFRQSWIDPRLAYPRLDNNSVVLGDTKFIWTPDLFFNNGRGGHLHNVIHPNVFIRILKDGSVLFSERLTVTFSCPMDFRKYPHDIQECLIQAESYGFNIHTIDISWMSSRHLEINKDIVTPFEVKLIKESERIQKLTTGEYKAIRAELAFHRKIGHFITKLYLPYILLTFLSFLTFWIPLKLVPHRMTLLVLIIYAMMNIGNEINAKAPKTSYTKGSDVWIAVCQTLVFGALLEFVVVHVVEASKDGCQKKPGASDCEELCAVDADGKMTNPTNKEASNERSHGIASRLKLDQLQSDRIEAISRILFPVLFICFNFIYWIVY